MPGTNETVADLSVVTPDIAREVWESFERTGRRPTARAVALAIAQSGRYAPVSYRTIARWAKNNWRPQLRLVKSHPLHEAAKKVDAAVPVLTGDPLTRASDTADASDFDGQSLRCEVHALSDEELIRRAWRGLYVNAIVLLQYTQHRPYLVETMPGELATLIQAIAASVATANRECVTVLDITDRIRKAQGGISATDGDEEEDDYADVFDGLQVKKPRAMAMAPQTSQKARRCGARTRKVLKCSAERLLKTLSQRSSIQRGMVERNAEVPQDKRVEFRSLVVTGELCPARAGKLEAQSNFVP